MDMEKLSDEEVAAILFAMEREFDWARHAEDYDTREEYLDACENLLSKFNAEYEKRELSPSIVGEEY
ncbi:MAG: hypothetical protein ACXACY_29560 [Candidatus Hodarchaeales archaeon]|jgi:hypothetical protein